MNERRFSPAMVWIFLVIISSFGAALVGFDKEHPEPLFYLLIAPIIISGMAFVAWVVYETIFPRRK